jgi:hypothetical protein
MCWNYSSKRKVYETLTPEAARASEEQTKYTGLPSYYKIDDGEDPPAGDQWRLPDARGLL